MLRSGKKFTAGLDFVGDFAMCTRDCPSPRNRVLARRASQVAVQPTFCAGTDPSEGAVPSSNSARRAAIDFAEGQMRLKRRPSYPILVPCRSKHTVNR